MKKIRVIVVDDSALIRALFKEILESDPAIEVIATASDPLDAREKIKKLNPDVVTLDIEMPKMDGLSFLQKIMSLRPMPVVMVSSLTQKGARATIEALELGAVDYVPKTGSGSFDVDNLRNDLIEKIKTAARAKIGSVIKSIRKEEKQTEKPGDYRKDAVIAIGSSTGGVEALREIVSFLPENTPPILITQHMPPAFTSTFAQRLNGLSKANIFEAKNNDKISPGNVYIAPGAYHMSVKKRGNNFICQIEDGEPVSGHKPSVDVLFESFAASCPSGVGVILTGMGKDGAKGMLKMKCAGAFTIGQNESTSLVYGMPKAAYMAGAVDMQLPLQDIAREMLKQCTKSSIMT